MGWVFAGLAALALTLAFYYRGRAAAAHAERERVLRLAGEAESGFSDVVESARQTFDSLMDACGASVLVVNSQNVIQQANVTASSLFGRPVHELIGQPLFSVTLSQDLEDRIRVPADDPQYRATRLRIEGPGGRALRASIRRLPLLDEGGRGALIVLQDETKLRRLETMRQDFVANVSHELRTPLASIRAMAEALGSGAMEDPALSHEFVETIVKEADRLTRIANDLLTLSDAESRAPSKIDFDFSEFVRDVLLRLRAPADLAGLELVSEIHPGLHIVASRDQMEQVLVNLVDNAIKYTPRGGTVRVAVSPTDTGIGLFVSDTGIGIMQEHLPRIFERFYRVDKARSRESGGTGLGLAIVKHMVEAHGGTVAVESEFNRGTTFRVELPCA
jgi:two-component system phosphate regulon sensor histidine kinase PhoR